MHEQVQTLVDAGRLDASVGEKISQLEPGVFCNHQSWGPGRIKEWDLFGDRISIDFEDKPGHAMKLEFAARSLQPLEEGHVFAKFVGDPEATRALALEDPISFAEMVLSSFGGSMLLDEWEDKIKGRMVPEAKYRSWWESSKKVIRTDRRFVLPPKRNVPFELRDGTKTPSAALLGDFDAAKDAKSKIKVLESIRKDLEIFEQPAAELGDVIKSASAVASLAVKKTPGPAIELLMARDDLITDVEGLELGENVVLAEVLESQKARLPEIVKGMGVGRQRELYTSMQEAGGDNWEVGLLECLEGSGARAIAEITKFLNEAGKGKELSQHLLSGLGQRSLGAEVLAWICKERNGLATEAFSQSGLTSAIIGALERDHLDESTPKSNRLHDLLLDDKTLVGDLLKESDKNEVRHFTRRVQSTPVFEGLNKNSLLARIVKAFPQVEDLVSGEKEERKKAVGEVEDTKPKGNLLVSWESLRERQERFDEIVNKKIPENSKEIGIAREYGDLKENFEFKAAKQQQAVLMRQKAEMEVEIATARGTDFTDADTSLVSVGTIVGFSEVGSEKTETVTVLGAWDTDTEKGIVSYLSGMGAALLGKKVGDELDLATTEEGETRKVRIVSIEAYATKSSD